MKYKNNLARLLNLNYLKYGNRTISCGAKDLPSLFCNTEVYPDYLALYSQTSLYHNTDRTAVCFFQYDLDFDGKNGLFWAIYYDDKERLAYYRERFKDVKLFISPDYSILGDVHWIEDEYRLFKSRIASLWLLFELDAVVIPNISFPTEENHQFALSGLDECSVIAISTKGHMDDPAEYRRLKNNIRLITDSLNVKAIIVYDVCGNNDATLDAFSYALNRHIEIVIPDNTLKHQNALRAEKRG